MIRDNPIEFAKRSAAVGRLRRVFAFTVDQNVRRRVDEEENIVMSFSQLAARRRFLTESLVGAATFWFPSRFFQSGETRADERRASDARPVWRENATVRSEYLEEQEVVRLVFSSATCPGGVRDYRVELEWKFLDHWEPLTSLSFPVRDVLRKSSETMTVDLDSLPRYVRYRAKIAALSSRGAESEKKLETEFVTKRPAPPVPRLGS